MGRELQKKKNRSSLSKVKQKPKSKRRLNPLGNPIIAANWRQNETLTQNYRRLGLTSRLNSFTGGIEKLSGDSNTQGMGDGKARGKKGDGLEIKSEKRKKMLEPTEARVERDEESGRILRVLYDGEEEGKKRNPLGDLLASDSDSEGEEFDGFEDTGAQSGVVKELEEMASREAPKKERSQSDREKEWIERLVGRYGEDYEKMARDRKLNPMQQMERDIRRRVEKWRGKEGGGGGVSGVA